MGTSKRYAAHFDRLMDDRVVQGLMRDHSPDTLTPLELQLDSLPLTRTPAPERVRVWVRYGGTPVRVDARAVAWTVSAVAVTWDTPGGEHRAWVWSGAVERQ